MERTKPSRNYPPWVISKRILSPDVGISEFPVGNQVDHGKNLKMAFLAALHLAAFWVGAFIFAARVCSLELQTHFSHTFLRKLPHGKLVFSNDFHGTVSNWMEILCNPRPRNDKAFIFLPRDLCLLQVWGCDFCVCFHCTKPQGVVVGWGWG